MFIIIIFILLFVDVDDDIQFYPNHLFLYDSIPALYNFSIDFNSVKNSICNSLFDFAIIKSIGVCYCFFSFFCE